MPRPSTLEEALISSAAKVAAHNPGPKKQFMNERDFEEAKRRGWVEFRFDGTPTIGGIKVVIIGGSDA